MKIWVGLRAKPPRGEKSIASNAGSRVHATCSIRRDIAPVPFRLTTAKSRIMSLDGLYDVVSGMKPLSRLKLER